MIKLRFYCWSALVLTCAIYLSLSFFRGYHFDSSIMALLPESEQSLAEVLATKHLVNASDQRLIFLLKDTDKARSAAAAKAFTAALDESQLFASILGQSTASPTASWQQFYQARRYQLLSSDSRQRLQNHDTTLADDSLGRLFSPLASVVAEQLLTDPLQLFFQWQLAVIPNFPFTLEDGWLTRSDDPLHYRLISTELLGKPYDIAYQKQVMSVINKAEAALPAEIKLLRSGLMLHAAHGAKQAIGEISTIGIGSALGIFCLLFACFRQLRAVAIAFLPIIVGCGFALTCSLLLFDSVHLITLAFGAGLVGVAIDYSLHFLCAHNPESHHFQSKRQDQRSGVLRSILPSLSMGLASSVLAYTAQGMAPFPGLRQMAVFSALGLIGAWLTVICWLPLLCASKPIAFNTRLINQLKQWQSRWPKIDALWLKTTLIILTLSFTTVVYTIEGNDDIRLLQTSPPELLNEDITVQKLLAAASPARYLILESDSVEALLQLEESFAEKLDAAKAAGEIANYMSTSQFLPSQQRQHENHSLLEKTVYGEQGQLHRLAVKGGLAAIEKPARQVFNDTPLDILQVDDWFNSDISAFTTHLWIGDYQGQHYSLITLFGIKDTQAIGQLAELARTVEGVEFVDRVAGISLLLANYRQQLSQWLILAYGLVLTLTTLRYGRQAWRVVSAPALASLAVLSLLQLNGSPITVFHGLALLLVLGIGLDASIFLQDSDNSPYTWLAVTLSSLTTLLAFGLLALSSTPVLHYFGVTVLLGIICVWILAPCFVTRHSQCQKGVDRPQ